MKGSFDALVPVLMSKMDIFITLYGMWLHLWSNVSDAGFDGAIIGAFIGGLFTLAGSAGTTWWLTRREVDAKKAELHRDTRNFLVALRTELNAGWKHYMDHVGKEIKTAGKTRLDVFIAIESDRYPLYQANAGKLANIQNQKLLENIIVTYTSLKSLQDDITAHNLMVTTHRSTVVKVQADNISGRSALRKSGDMLRGSASNLKRGHAEAESLVPPLIEELARAIRAGMF